MKLCERWTAVKEAIRRNSQRIGRLCASHWWIATRRHASGWRELVWQPWSFWVGVGVLLLTVGMVIYGIAVSLLSILPALMFFVAFGLLVAKVCYSSGASLSYRIFEGTYWVAASYIPAYLMFALTADLPRNRDLKNTRPFLASPTAMLAGGAQAVLAALAEAAGHKVADPPTQKDFDEICKHINSLGLAPLLKRSQPREYATWIEFLFYRRQRSARAIEKLFW
jgi:hypothetical protein